MRPAAYRPPEKGEGSRAPTREPSRHPTFPQEAEAARTQATTSTTTAGSVFDEPLACEFSSSSTFDALADIPSEAVVVGTVLRYGPPALSAISALPQEAFAVSTHRAIVTAARSIDWTGLGDDPNVVSAVSAAMSAREFEAVGEFLGLCRALDKTAPGVGAIWTFIGRVVDQLVRREIVMAAADLQRRLVAGDDVQDLIKEFGDVVRRTRKIEAAAAAVEAAHPDRRLP